LTNFKNSGNKPEWLVITTIPVIPADLRPLVQLGSGRNVVSGINELYRKVIIRNNRLKEMQKVGSPRLLLNDERVSLQNAVNDLFDNSKNNESLNSGVRNKKIQKSLVEQLKGKQGRFRQNLLGKRVDFSGRSVIVVGPNLKLDECGLPKEMALELFKPLVMGQLLKKEKAPNIPATKRKIEARDEDVWEELELIVEQHKVLLNRAPTLHRLGIQAFKPKLVEGKAIRLSPLVCAAYNADFDGDQMAVHLPLSKKAQEEATKLMLASNNILNPKDGQPIVAPSQDMILGNYYITLEEEKDDIHIFKDTDEAIMAYENRLVNLHQRVFIDAKMIRNATLPVNDLEHKLVLTTVGKLLFNDITPDDYPYLCEPSLENLIATPDKYLITKGTDLRKVLKETELNQPFKKSSLSSIIYNIFEKYDIPTTSKMLDAMKDIGFKYSCLSGISISYTDVPSVVKEDVLFVAQNKVTEWNNMFNEGLITEDERYQKITQDFWPKARDVITDRLMSELSFENNIYMMSDSGARGNRSNFTQLGAMRGLMSAPSGRIIELPVKSSFKEGLTVLEYFISSHGARKGLADTALKTADSGYLTRRLVDVAQDVVISEEDCDSYDYNIITDMTEGTEIIVPLKERIIGRTLQEDIVDKKGVIIFEQGISITELVADKIIILGYKAVKIRNIFTCKSKDGICKKCYGRDLATNNIVNIGEAVGIISAQSIGEPGTQLTMRTFHTGGVAGADITQGLPRVVELFEAGAPHGKAYISTETGKLKVTEKAAGFEVTILVKREVIATYNIPHGIKIKYQTGDTIKRGQVITEGSIHPRELLEYRGINEVRAYILKEIQRVYRLQGVGINDKHVEIIVSQMMKYVRVIDAGDTKLIPGELIRHHLALEKNYNAISKGKKPAMIKVVIMGIKKASLETESFLSAASFQETAKTLSNATIRGKRDYLYGIKENVIVGKKIPAGTGKVENYKNIGLDE
ncbi:MAG: DNA-directed RNA polymerase subunit beta', partial [Spiroplasma sp.]|nr:DNA-directed RNA polymerase subunit beta' [Mycoplasmatales bacterium]